MTKMIFNVTTEEANLLIAGLAELPFKTAAGLISKLQFQAAPQLAEEAAAAQVAATPVPEAANEAPQVQTSESANAESVPTQGE